MLHHLGVWITRPWGAVTVLVSAAALAALAVVTSPSQPAADATDGLPAHAQSTRVTELATQFPTGRTDALIVVFERRDGVLTAADQTAVDAARRALLPLAVSPQVPPATTAADQHAVLLTVPVPGLLDTHATTVLVDDARTAVRHVPLPAGLTALVTGGPAIGRDVAAAFDGADLTLLLATAGVVAVLLLLTYRSPLLWMVPLAVIGVADQVVGKLLPWIARAVGERTDAAISGIVSVLVFGAGTDYALLLISRYREELWHTPDRRAAMATALREAAPAVVASAGTVVLALLALLAAAVTGNRTLGMSAALGVVVALLFGLLVLPAAVVSLPRHVFWPFVPRPGTHDPTTTGFWARVAGGVARRPVAVLVAAVIILAGLTAGLGGTRIGLSPTEQFRTQVDSVTGQQALSRHFPAGAGQPVRIVTAIGAAHQVAAAVRGLPGVAGIGQPEPSDDGHLAQIAVQLLAEPGTPPADRSVEAIRAAVADVPRADAAVGGVAAADLDARRAYSRDNTVVAPLILAVVFLVLIVLLRSLLAPVLLVLTVVASFAASLGAGSLILRQLLHMPGLDRTVPLLAFLFLVALGVDYNIFLITRAREETVRSGDTTPGTLRALAATGGVITSAGILLAAVFTVLGVLPVVALTQIGVIVGIGVLLDTLLVRTLVVPALALLLRDTFWWPARPPRPPSPPTGPRRHGNLLASPTP